MGQVVAYKRLKIMEINKLSGPKSGRGPAHKRWSFTRGSNCKTIGSLSNHDDDGSENVAKK